MEITAKEEAGKIVDKGFKSLLSGEANSALNKALASIFQISTPSI